MNTSMVRYILGYVLKLEALLLMFPCIVAGIYGEKSGMAILFTALLCLIIGFAFSVKKPTNTTIYLKEGCITTALSWIILSIFGALPFVFSGEIPNFTDALFEVISGFTTTGASILSDVEVDFEKVKKDLVDFSKDKDFVVIEGAGGLLCPAVKGMLFSDVIKKLEQEIVIVTTPSLGRINHTLMTIDCAYSRGIKIKGLIINKMPKNKTLSEENFVKELKMFTDVEILGIIPELKNPTKKEIVEAFKEVKI